MKATLKSINRPEISKTIILILRENEVLITTEDGEAIGSLSVEIMDKDVERNGKFIIEPTESFWVIFNPVEAGTQKNCADVFNL